MLLDVNLCSTRKQKEIMGICSLYSQSHDMCSFLISVKMSSIAHVKQCCNFGLKAHNKFALYQDISYSHQVAAVTSADSLSVLVKVVT